METLDLHYGQMIREMIGKARATDQIGEEDVYQEGNREILPYVDKIVEDGLLPGSDILRFENLERLLALAKEGKSCLLLLEHYSNFDLPVFHLLLRRHGEAGQAIADALVSIAGVKLSETSPIVSAFTEAYSRIVIYPSRSMEIIQRNLTDPKELVSEMMRAMGINRAAMKALNDKKVQGRIVLVFPAGTRFRPWEPETKKGVREIASYLKTFDYMCPVSINGNILRLNPNGDMHADLFCKDRVLIDAGLPEECAAFRERAKHERHWNEDKKQAIVDAVMAQLDVMHQVVEKRFAEAQKA